MVWSLLPSALRTHPRVVRHKARWAQEAATIRVKNLLIAIDFRLYRNSLGILHHKKEKDVCDECGEKFAKYVDLISHARHIHHHPIVKCDECGKEFIHEKDRLHHVREEHKKKAENRQLKNLHQREK